MKRPKIFISSTVHDFRDLRSSLKFWLEELGYQVQLSEFNDFEKDLDSNSYQACLKSIGEVNYYILLIGSRVGGYYDEKKKISITQQEYRTAYKLAEKKGIKLISFVRKELWDIKNDRKALAKLLELNFLKAKEFKKFKKDLLVYHKSEYVNDANFIFSFIDEVCRKGEMVKAVKGKGKLPERNWIHHFVTFKDIIDVLKNALPIHNKLNVLAHLYNIRLEIVQNLIHFHSKESGKIAFGVQWGTFVRKQIKGGISDRSMITGKYLKWLSMFEMLYSRQGSNLSTEFIDNFLLSGEGLEFDSQTKSYEAGNLYNALLRLKKDIRQSKEILQTDTLAKSLRDFSDKYSAYDGDQKYSVDNLELILVLTIMNLQINIYSVSLYVLNCIDKEKVKNFSEIRLEPSSPFEVESNKIDVDKITLDEMLIHLKIKSSGIQF